MKLFYDLHLHSCLSPCGDEDATPANLAGMLSLAGLDVVALTDHNSCGNCAPFLRRAAGLGLVALPGMELTTSEEVHVICLFERLDDALAFERVVYCALPDVPNRPEVFGRQLLIGEDDEIAGEEPRLLLSATSIGIYDVTALAAAHGGVAFPAHIDRASFSLLANLGFWDDAMGFTFYERTRAANPELMPLKPWLVNSDAHRLEDIPDAAFRLEAPERSAGGVLRALKRLNIVFST